MGQGVRRRGTSLKRWQWTWPASPGRRRAVLPNNILVLSDDTRNSSISDFVEEGSRQPPDLPPCPHAPVPAARPICGPIPWLTPCPAPRHPRQAGETRAAKASLGAGGTELLQAGTHPRPTRGQGGTCWDTWDLSFSDDGAEGDGVVGGRKDHRVPGLAGPRGMRDRSAG